MMELTRRGWLASCASALAARSALAIDSPDRLGLVVHSFAIRGADRSFAEASRFLEHVRKLGVGSVQVGIGARDDASADALREQAEAASMHLEGIVALPREEGDLARFEAEIRAAKRAGATIVRTVLLSGRRYEAFDSLDAFRRFQEASRARLQLAAPVVTRHGVRLAVENHKDYRADELIEILKAVGCDHIGVCLDTGNSIALLEDPMEVVEALAPRAFTTHFKDMGVQEYPEGFLLSEVPLGTGFLDLRRIVQTCRAANPAIAFNIEMITRDPLRIPCLTDRYWTTFPDLPGRHLARSLSMVRAHVPPAPLPRISNRSPDEKLQAEDENVRRCLAFARGGLGL
jgi:sugar phosphate isomerase/epimerase